VIPIADDSPKKYIPFINYIIIFMNIVVYYFQPSNPEALAAFFNKFGLISAELIQNPEKPVVYLKIFTSMFIHADFMHLGGNMLYLWIFGDNIEYTIGHGRYLLFYLVVGLAAAMMQIIIFPGSSIPMVGASGAISGILGAYLIKFPKNKISILFFFIIIIRIVRVPAVFVLSFWFIFQIYNGYFSSGDAGVAWFAHIGGFIAGFILIKIFEYYPRYD
jgi:membrane associated rhomboid family serine protease